MRSDEPTENNLTGNSGRSEELSRTPDALLAAFVEALPLVAYVKDASGRYIYANPQMERQMGLSQVTGKVDEELFSRHGARQNERHDRQVLATGETIRTQEALPGADGTMREWACVKFLIQGENGRQYVGGAVTDVTEQRRAQRAVAESQSRLKAALEAGFDAFFILDAVRDDGGQIQDFVFVDVNRNAELMLNRSRWDLVKHQLCDTLPTIADAGFLERYSRVVETRTPLEEEYQVMANGVARWFRHQVVPLGEGIAITMREITDQKRAEALAIEHTRVLENALGGIAFISNEGLFHFANAEFCRMLATTPDELVGQPWHTAVDPEDVPGVQAAIERMTGDARIEAECRGLRRDGLPLEMRFVMIPVIREGVFVGHYVFAVDVTEQRRYERMLEEANARLKELAATDALTGLKNRREFQSRLVEEVSYAHRYRQALSLVMMDVDHFKQYNDTFGHPAGDDVLRRVARILLEEARIVDIVARYGGEEFAVILPGTDLEGAQTLADRFRAAIETANWPLRPITASFGCATYGDKYDSVEELISAADRALYISKAEGRNRVSYVE